jgi:hypothetical protein
LPSPSCELCGRKEGELHPALASWQRNDFLCLSELSDDFKQRFGLSEAGLLCRGCYVTLCQTLIPIEKDSVLNPADQPNPLDCDDGNDDEDDAPTEPNGDDGNTDSKLCVMSVFPNFFAFSKYRFPKI